MFHLLSILSDRYFGWWQGLLKCRPTVEGDDSSYARFTTNRLKEFLINLSCHNFPYFSSLNFVENRKECKQTIPLSGRSDFVSTVNERESCKNLAWCSGGKFDAAIYQIYATGSHLALGCDVRAGDDHEEFKLIQ